MKQRTKRNIYVIGGSAIGSYLLLYPLSTAIVLIFEKHNFDLAAFADDLFRIGHIYTGVFFVLIGLMIGLTIVYFLSKQDSVNAELNIINDSLTATNTGLRYAMENRKPDSHIFVESIRPTLIKIDDALNDLNRNRIQDIDHNKQIEITKNNVKQLVDLMAIITASESNIRS